MFPGFFMPWPLLAGVFYVYAIVTPGAAACQAGGLPGVIPFIRQTKASRRPPVKPFSLFWPNPLVQ